MGLFIKLAWRNIWRNSRRSFITILAIFFAAFLTVIMRGMQKGTYAANIASAVEMFAGYLQIQHKGFQESNSLSKAFKYSPEIRNILAHEKAINGYAPRIMADGLVGFKENSVGAAIFGIDPALEPNVSTIYKKIKEGKFINSNNKYDIVLGYKMLKNLKAKVGDTVVILASGFDGTMGNQKFRICGASRMGYTELDNMSVFMHIAAADEIMSMRGRINTIAFSINGLESIEIAKENLRADIKKLPEGGRNLAVLDWGEVMPDLKQGIELDNSTGIIFLGLLIIIVAFGILNTVVMSITERFKEFGVMLALGTKQTMLVIIVFFEMLFLTIIGTILGNLAGYGINYYIYKNPIVFTGDYGALYEEFGWLPAMHSAVTPDIFISTSLSIIIIALLVYIYPAYRLLKLEPLKGIRYT